MPFPIPFGLLFSAIGAAVPARYIVIGAVSIAIFAGGWFVRGWHEEGKQKDAIERAIKEANKQHEQDMGIMRDHVELERVIEVRYETITEYIPMVETPDCDDLSPDWVRVFNDAIRASE